MHLKGDRNARFWAGAACGLVVGYVLGAGLLSRPAEVRAQQQVFRGETAAALRSIAQTVERIAAATERIDQRLARLERASRPLPETRGAVPSEERVHNGTREAPEEKR